MRQPFNPEPHFQTTPIEKILLPLQSRDELPPILAGLQWIWMHPTLKTEILALLEVHILGGKKQTGRTGMDLWQILVLGVVRLGLDADWDRMEHLANYDLLLRQMLGMCPDPWGTKAHRFAHQTLRDNVALVDAVLLKQINILVAAAGRQVFVSKPSVKPAALQIKVDTYVLETDVHFPTDLNLLFDAGRKCLDLVAKYQKAFGYDLPGWRKLEDWRRRFKSAERMASKTAFGGGKDKDKRDDRRETLLVVRAAYRVAHQRQVAPSGRTGSPVIGGDRSAPTHSRLRRACGSRRQSKRARGQPLDRPLRGGSDCQHEL